MGEEELHYVEEVLRLVDQVVQLMENCMISEPQPMSTLSLHMITESRPSITHRHVANTMNRCAIIGILRANIKTYRENVESLSMGTEAHMEDMMASLEVMENRNLNSCIIRTARKARTTDAELLFGTLEARLVDMRALQVGSTVRQEVMMVRPSYQKVQLVGQTSIEDLPYHGSGVVEEVATAIETNR